MKLLKLSIKKDISILQSSIKTEMKATQLKGFKTDFNSTKFD